MGRFGPFCLAALLATAALLGCGGGGGDGSSSVATTTAKSTAQGTKDKPQGKTRAKEQSPPQAANPGPPASAFHPKPHHDSGGGSEQFRVKGGDNSVQDYGAEASEAEFEAAAAALHGFLDARAQGNWAAACTYLAAPILKSFRDIAAAAKNAHANTVAGKGCAAALFALSGRVPQSNLRQAAIANVGSLRVEGERAFLIYRGAPKGTVYAIGVVVEGGRWKVASLAGIPMN